MGYNKYYTFERDEYGITLVSHTRKQTEEVVYINEEQVESLDIAESIEEPIQKVSSTDSETEDDEEEVESEEEEEIEEKKEIEVDPAELEAYIEPEYSNSDEEEENLSEEYLEPQQHIIISDPKEETELFLSKGCIESFEYTVQKEPISVQEFSLLYLDYIRHFICQDVSKRTGYHDLSRYRYCVTRDRALEISDQAFMGILRRIIDTSLYRYKLLSLDRVEACAIYCRTLIHKRTLNNKRNQIYFLQVQMDAKQCALMLHHVPATQDKDSPLSLDEAWVGMYKQAKTKIVPMDVMDQICNRLWTHLQLYPKLVTRCYRHQHVEKLFRLVNRHVFKRKLQSYLSKVGKPPPFFFFCFDTSPAIIYI